MELHRLGFKFYAKDADGIDILKCIPVFHRWIQSNVLTDMLLDVADYSHVPAGPGVLLVAHEGNYGFDETGRRRGVVYYAKRPLPGDLGERLATICRKTLLAAKQLQDEPEFRDELRIGGSELQIFANDRLTAPNAEETLQALQPSLRALLERLYAGTGYTLERESDPKERFSVTVSAEQSVAVETLLERLAA
jgi:hypothetical protein